MEDIVMSTLGTFYVPSSVVRIIDRNQQYKYIEQGCFPRDIYVSNGDLVMCFDKNESTELYQKWREREL